MPGCQPDRHAARQTVRLNQVQSASVNSVGLHFLHPPLDRCCAHPCSSPISYIPDAVVVLLAEGMSDALLHVGQRCELHPLPPNLTHTLAQIRCSLIEHGRRFAIHALGLLVRVHGV